MTRSTSIILCYGHARLISQKPWLFRQSNISDANDIEDVYKKKNAYLLFGSKAYNSEVNSEMLDEIANVSSIEQKQ